jgi:hypothetical protein
MLEILGASSPKRCASANQSLSLSLGTLRLLDQSRAFLLSECYRLTCQRRIWACLARELTKAAYLRCRCTTRREGEFFELSVPERYNEVTILEHQPSATRCGRRPRH